MRQSSLHEFLTLSTGLNDAQPAAGLHSGTSYAADPLASIPWGDPVSSGQEVVRTSTFRLLSHNVNGLSAADQHAEVRHFAEAISEKEVALFGIQEPNRNFERNHMLTSFHRIIAQVSTHHKGAVSSAKMQWPQDYQPGGTAISVRNKWTARYLDKGSDDLGRWSWITLAGQGNTKITFLTAYRVCDGASEAPITARTVRAQQEWIYADRGYATINLRQQFVLDLIKQLQLWQKAGHDLVVMLDANEPAGPGSATDRIIYACNLTDVHQRHTEAIDPPPTHNRGSRKIDFVLVSNRLVPTITSRTILPLYDGYLSDHRALLVDFDSKKLFESHTSDVTPPCGRQLTSTDPKAVHRYMSAMLKQIAKHDVIRRIAVMQQRSETDTWTDEDTQQWEIVDRILAQARIYAERKCRKKKKKSGHMPWSPELQMSGQTLLYWRYRMREHTSRQTNPSMLASLSETCAISEDDKLWMSVTDISVKISEAKASHKVVKMRAAEMRDVHMNEQATLLADLHGMAEPAARAAIAAREKSSGQFRTLRSIFKAGQSHGLERLDVPDASAVLRRDEPTPRIQLVTKEEIEEVLLPHTEKRFRQHQETPFGQGTRSSRLGQDCDTLDFDMLRFGTYDHELETLSAEAREWLRHLQEKDFVSEGRLISTNISTDDWVAGWIKMRESTASAPGGHYGHYKTAAVAARLPRDHPDHTRTLAEIYAAMLSIPLRQGFAPTRWQHCVDAILEKIPGKPIIEKLRIIMLYEADFNFMLKLIWGRRLVRHAERYKCLGTSNHGSRSGRQTIDALLEKLLLYEYARLTRTSLVTVDNDAKSCYDRIIKSLAMIACIGVGLPLLAAAMHNKTHHGMRHTIKTKHGMLRPYFGTDDNPLEGSGQGSGASPAIWLIYSISLLNAFRQFTPGMHVSSPYETLLVVILAIFYVDDGMPGVNDATETDATPLPILLQRAEDATQAWERLLFVSGGALELSKCFAYIVYWDLSDGKHRLIRPSEIPMCTVEGTHYRGPIGLTYGQINPVRNLLETEDPWVGRRTLGVRIAPAGNWTDEYAYRRAQSRELALQIAGATMSRSTARLGYFMMVCPKLEYPLGVTQFTQQQCDDITSPVIRASLSKMGYNCNMPKEVIYGPPSLFGVGLHDYYIEQGVHQLLALFGHIRQDSDTSKMMRIELQWCQVQAGTRKHLLSDPTDDIDYIETCWIMSIRDFLRTYGMSIDLTTYDETEDHSLLDEFIMDALRERGDCTATQLQRLNACRMYLRVARLSDISSADGRNLRKECLSGVQLHSFRSRLKWPRQGNPPTSWWSLWSRKLRLVFTADGSHTRLRRPLGEWTKELRHDEWRTMCAVTDTSVEVFHLRNDGMYDCYRDTNQCSSGRRKFVNGNPIGTVDSIPRNSVPADLGPARRTGSRPVYFRHKADTHGMGISLQHPASFCDFVSRQSAHIGQIMAHSDRSDDAALRIMKHLYKERQIVAGTDGGLLNHGGTFGYVWAGSDGSHVLTSGQGNVPGQPVSMSSTRTEMCGLFAALTHVRLVIEYYHMVLPKGGVKAIVYCDSKAALQRVQDLEFDGFGTTWRCRSNYDIESAIRMCMKKQPDIHLQWLWVRGHASRRKRPENFTMEETLNEAADALATSARNYSNMAHHPHWPEQRISLLGPYGRVSGRLVTEVRYCCTSADLLSYWQQRYGWTTTQARTVDIVGTEIASKRMSPDKARRIQKLRCGWLPVNHRESRSDPDRLPGCSACSQNNLVRETVDHVFQCASTERRRAILDKFRSFHTTLRKYKTSRAISDALMTGSLAWIEGRPTPLVDTLLLPDTPLGHLVRQAYLEQDNLGWNVLFRGFWSTSWRLAQHEAFSTMRGRELYDTGEQWAAKAQIWYYDLFDFIWGLRNVDEHGADIDTQRLIRLSKCERAIRRLYDKGEDLPNSERHPFREPIEDLLQQTVLNQELWIFKTGGYLVKASKRARARPPGQPAITTYFPRL